MAAAGEGPDRCQGEGIEVIRKAYRTTGKESGRCVTLPGRKRAAAYALALYLPGPGYLTALAGMMVGGLMALLVIWPEFRLLFRL